MSEPDLDSLVFSCSRPEDIFREGNRIRRALSVELRKRFNRIFSTYGAGYGIQGAYERLNNRTVVQIFAEYKPVDLNVIASGEVKGLKYRLTEAPSSPPESIESPPKEP